MKKVRIWTDGACFPNPGQGGWAWTSEEGKESSGYEAHSTNQRMELRAVLEAIESNLHLDEILIISDSRYVIQGVTEWMPKWVANHWMRGKKPVMHQDLWGGIYEAMQKTSVHFQWVKGHSGDVGNDRADQLAMKASRADLGLIQVCLRKWHP